jgi:hypothetical protein
VIFTLDHVKERAAEIVRLNPEGRNVNCVYADEQGFGACIVGRIVELDELLHTDVLVREADEYGDTDYGTLADNEEQIVEGAHRILTQLGYTYEAIDWLSGVQQICDTVGQKLYSDDPEPIHVGYEYPLWADAIAEWDEAN